MADAPIHSNPKPPVKSGFPSVDTLGNPAVYMEEDQIRACLEHKKELNAMQSRRLTAIVGKMASGNPLHALSWDFSNGSMETIYIFQKMNQKSINRLLGHND